ncbi:MAG: tetratricopeptide repeat protein [Deltaproteobacteria bacterium]|nr:tetratricopeptide repeat protein [Deltaproteobacteria bacterium]MBW2531521.1 tetratricopeptide repeat protein [Deltaproteobacteria bacterium]
MPRATRAEQGRGPFRRRCFAQAPALALVAALAVGCGPSVGARGPGDEVKNQLAAVPVTDTDFGVAVHRLLREGKPTAARSALLAGVMRRQMSRSASHFAHDDVKRGTSALIGALYLLRAGESRPDMFGPDGDEALEGGIRAFSARGDEGRALALMLMRQKLLPGSSPDRKELEQHLVALRRWMRDARTGGDMEQLGDDMTAAINRSLIDPSKDALAEAARAISAWIERAVEYNLEFHRTGNPPPPHEGKEAFRALQTGGATMLAIFLRHGLAQSALDHIESTAARRVIPPPLFRLVETTADDDDASDWRALAQVLARDSHESEPLLRLEPELRDAAMWGAALEAYRRDPTSLAIAHILAGRLYELGMPEAAPLVLQEALGESPSPVALSGCLAVVGEMLESELNARTITTARGILASAAPILAVADRSEYRGRLEPSAAQVRDVMARIEIRAGQVDAARPLMLATLKAEPSVWGYTRLAMLERQVGNHDVALAHAQRALTLPAARLRVPGSGHLLDVADAHLLAFEIHRDRKQRDSAVKALESALRITLQTRQIRIAPRSQVRAELLLARILDGFGDHARAARAVHRALEIAMRDRPLLGAAMLGAIGRALVVADLSSARAALQRGIDADLEQDDLVYGALWLQLLEQQQGDASDGKVDRVLSRDLDPDEWSGKLARWAQGRLTDDALRKGTHSYAEQVEADFYAAMRLRAADPAKARTELRQVADNPLIDLMEVQIARDLLAPKLTAAVPEKYQLP